MFHKVLIANRGAIATRIQRTLRTLGVKSVAVYAEADRESPFVREADEAFSLGEGAAADTYLDIDKLIAIARESGAQAVHPGYGFLSENTRFIQACDAAGLVFLGPTVEQIHAFGLKHEARTIAENAGVPLVPGTGLLDDVESALSEANRIGYPVMLKSTAGGGGIGMQVCEDATTLNRAFESVKGLGERNFGDGGVFLEAYIARARHLEVQLFGDGEGQVIALGERDCSSQRRHQKVIEECPASDLPEHVRDGMIATAISLGKAVNYRSAGTVEFIYDAEREAFYFLEVNTRLQVEHGVTELVWDVDIVDWMLKLGAGELGDLAALAALLSPRGHAMQARVYAENPQHDFRPSSGLLTEVELSDDVVTATLTAGSQLRVDHSIEAGFEVPAWFDPMLAKVMVHAPTREQARGDLSHALAASRLYGIETNRQWLSHLLEDPRFINVEIYTRWLEGLEWAAPTFEVIVPGTLTTVQDMPGRQGHWDVGVPPSGPFDDFAFRLGNALLGNALLDSHADAAGLEITLNGPTLRFNRATRIVLAGAPLPAQLTLAPQDDTAQSPAPQSLALWQVHEIAAGSTLSLGKIAAGARSYLLIAGGIDCPQYLGSRATFTLGQFGGHAGRALRSGDTLPLANLADCAAPTLTQLPTEWIPQAASSVQDEQGNNAQDKAPGREWQIGVLYGPHGAPDFFTEDDISSFFDHRWEVHYNSSRTGVRLIGPRPQWARADGGEAGLHPSNIHDNAYAFGTIDFTGDMPVILGPDGPSLGGFVCPATVVRAERWKLGQLAAGDRIRFVALTLEEARTIEVQQDALLAALASGELETLDKPTAATTSTALSTIAESRPRPDDSPVLKRLSAEQGGEQIIYRRAGDDFLLIEFGEMELDIALRFRAHAWMLWLKDNGLDGLMEMTPGIRSLQLHYDPRTLSLAALMAHLEQAEVALKDVEDIEIEARTVHLPLSWDDPACQQAIDKYQRSVRPDAPWCPSNLEFIRRINGLADEAAVRETVLNARYLVMGLGDVYLGAPVATPLDPRQRLVTTKYNPARTWTAENSVGIGGAYLCVYGMEGPGGYQFVGRTLQMWNRYRRTEHFTSPWLLRVFDQLRFHPVSHEDLNQIRRDHPQGRYDLKIEKTRFRLADYQAQIAEHQDETDAFRARRQAAFQQEIDDWHARGQFTFEDQVNDVQEADSLAEDESGIETPVTGSLWKLEVAEGDLVEAGQVVALVESMKMEVEIRAHAAGRVVRLPIKEGSGVAPGQPLIVLSTELNADTTGTESDRDNGTPQTLSSEETL
ncbi:urea carboxylase [Cobetia sp. L2A1]|uniref:urea carboxylase n=1 Tax=Cobetia sp. L2A1 TaxID=2686360 RepID=UPI00131B67D8|nr:urea carboxylase [Cobetia sp. L2A1]